MMSETVESVLNFLQVLLPAPPSRPCSWILTKGVRRTPSPVSVLPGSLISAFAGATAMQSGFAFVSLPAGYLGSTFIGSSLIFAGFNQKASKIAVFPILLIMCCCMWWSRKDMFVICHVMFSMGIMAALCKSL